MEIPNRYHPRDVVSDPHHELFGMTLLNRADAMEYFTLTRGGIYDVRFEETIGEYNAQQYQRNLNRFYVQTWRVPVTKR